MRSGLSTGSAPALAPAVSSRLSTGSSSSSSSSRTRLKRKSECKEVWVDLAKSPVTTQFREALKHQKLEAAEQGVMQARDIPRVVNTAGVYEEMRKVFFKEYFEQQRASKHTNDEETVRTIRQKARLRFAKITSLERIQLARR